MKCFKCEGVIHISWPHLKEDNKIYCIECAFKENKISDQFYMKISGFSLDGYKAKYIKEKDLVQIVRNKQRFMDEYNPQDERRSKEYRAFRKKVLERDNYICKKCGSTDKLLVHHKKSFLKYPKLRTEVKNGLTVCSDCHKKIHSKRR